MSAAQRRLPLPVNNAPRLSSRLTLLIRGVYFALIGGLTVGSAWTLVAGGTPGVPEYLLASCILASGAFVLRLFAFVHLELRRDELIVRGLLRERRVHISLVDDVIVKHRGFPHSIAFGRVTLAAAVPGLGSQLRFVAPTFGSSEDIEAAILAARTSRASAPSEACCR